MLLLKFLVWLDWQFLTPSFGFSQTSGLEPITFMLLANFEELMEYAGKIQS